jgi:hypothetical protein
MKDKLLKTVRVTLFVLVATVITGCGLLESDLIESQNVKRDVLKLCGAGSDWSTSDVKVLNWSWNTDLIGDTYTGYLVTYEIGSGYYALVSLIEFDETSRYEIELVYRGRSLSDLNSHIIH